MMGTADAPGGEPELTTDQRAFADFYRRELAGQVRRATLILGSPDAANDVVHDAFVAIFRRWGAIAEPGPYLNIAVLNGCRDLARRRKRSRSVTRRLETAPTTVDHDEILWDVLMALPFAQRAAVVLRFYAGMTEREIATVLDCSPGSVGPWISRALASMRKALS